MNILDFEIHLLLIEIFIWNNCRSFEKKKSNLTYYLSSKFFSRVIQEPFAKITFFIALFLIINIRGESFIFKVVLSCDLQRSVLAEIYQKACF